jgi:hypothetical protein
MPTDAPLLVGRQLAICVIGSGALIHGDHACQLFWTYGVNVNGLCLLIAGQHAPDALSAPFRRAVASAMTL